MYNSYLFTHECDLLMLSNSYRQNRSNIHLISSVSPMDYEALSTTLMFAACETRQCVDVTIVDGMIVESIETFAVTLERTSDLDSRITLNPVDEEIKTIDNDCKLTVLHTRWVLYALYPLSFHSDCSGLGKDILLSLRG